MYSLKWKKSNKGFTLLEMMVSFLIIGLVSTISVVSYRSANKRTELVLAAQKLASDIRMAQNYTMSTKDLKTVPTYGWGVHLDKTSGNNTKYVLFGDTNGNKAWNSNEGFATSTLPAGVTISDIVAGASSLNSLDIFFTPPDPATFINNSTTTDATTTLSNASGNTTVKVNFLGMIEAN